MKLSAAAGYALVAAAQLNHDVKMPPLPCSAVAKTGGMPERFLLQILKRLVDVGLLRSVRGLHGGYYLARPAMEISVAEIIEAIDGPLVETPALIEGLTPSSARMLAKEIAEIGRHAHDRLAALRLSDLQTTHHKKLAKVAS